MIAKKSLELVTELGGNASSLDNGEVAYILQNSNLFEPSRKTFVAALGVFEKYSDEKPSDDYVNFTHYQTYVFWANTVGISNCDASNKSLDQAAHYSSLLSPAVLISSGAQAQIQNAKMNLASCSR
jgi:hypothetical protein